MTWEVKKSALSSHELEKKGEVIRKIQLMSFFVMITALLATLAFGIFKGGARTLISAVLAGISGFAFCYCLGYRKGLGDGRLLETSRTKTTRVPKP